MSFHDLNLDSTLLDALDRQGFTVPTEVQLRAIPIAMAGHDLLASAQTGTGKTAAFVLPMLHRLLQPSKGPGKGPRALILTPTRELGSQVADVVRKLGQYARLRSGLIVGGVPYPPQQRLLRGHLDILVATPGRLIDHLERGMIDFSRLEVLVLDEADRMLDMGFAEAVEQIIDATPAQRQTLLFSATLEGSVTKVASQHLNDPQRVELAAATQRHTSIEQWVHQTNGLKHKTAVVNHLLEDELLAQAVVFVATKRTADELADELADLGHTCAPLHGDMTQGARRRTVERVRKGQVKVLVATDVAARGLDVKGISHVINYDLPMTPDDYIHRIGRTGRAGADGIAISLVGRRDNGKLSQIERFTGQRLQRRNLPRLAPIQGQSTQRNGEGAHRDEGNRNDRPSYGEQRRNRDERPAHGEQRRSQDDRPSYGEQRRNRDDRPAYGEQRRSQGDRPSYGEQRRNRDERPARGEQDGRRTFKGKRTGTGRPDFHGKNVAGQNTEGRATEAGAEQREDAGNAPAQRRSSPWHERNQRSGGGGRTSGRSNSANRRSR